MQNGNFIFTSESVTEGHPDKVADQISDAVLDAILKADPKSRVACETLVKTGMAIIAGEITTSTYVHLPDIVRRTIKKIGYDSSLIGYDWETCAVLSAIERQSGDIAQGVDEGAGLFSKQGAGDQGMMFGYACDDTETYMPAPIHYAHLLTQRLAKVRKSDSKPLPFLRPDGKSQVTVRYDNGTPVSIDTVVVSTQHNPDVSHDALQEAVIEEVVKKALPAKLLTNTTYLINPTGRFVMGGPEADAGVTGRKIIVDTYGGMARHGGGAFSGKDPSKVDRSAAYYSRYMAKNVVAAGLADKCEIQLAYAIGVAEPVSIMVDTFNTAKIPDARIVELLNKHFNAEPANIIEELDLLRPIYEATASYGHFGREDEAFTWERTNKAAALKDDAGL